MPKYYSGSLGGGGSSSGGYKPAKIGSSGGGGGGSIDVPEVEGPTYGKGSIDLTDFGGSIAQTAGSFAQFGGGLLGGAAGLIGGIGAGDGQNVGAIADIPGNALGAIGSLELPNADPNHPAATLGDVPGAMGDVISAPGKGLERTVAGQRVQAAQGDLVSQGISAGFGIASALNPLNALPNLYEFATTGKVSGLKNPLDKEELPPDLQARLDAGESVDAIADELVARGAGYSGNSGQNLVNEVLLDPLNLIAPAAGKIGSSIKDAGQAISTVDDFAKMNLPRRAAGIAYATASRGLNKGAAAFVDRALGPVTSGALHALGTAPYRRFIGGFGRLSRDYANRLHDSLGVANANLMNAVIADDLANDAASRLGNLDNVERNLGARLTARRAYRPDELERRAQELLQRTAPDFLGRSQEELTDFTARALAIATGSSLEDAVRIVGKASIKDAQTAHWARYGAAIDEFGEARRAALEAGDSNIDIDRLTLIGEDTLTTERAKALGEVEIGSLYDEAMRYEVLRNHFLGKTPSDGQIMEFVGKLAKEGALPEAVRQAKTGKNKLPGALSDFRVKWRENGYDLGFAPKDGLKTITDADGNVLWAKPFVGVTSRVDPVSVRNPLGRALDGLFRGVTQTTIVQESRQRMTKLIADAGLPISPNQVRGIHKAIIDEAATRSLTPRGLVGEKESGESIYNAIFKRFLTPDEYEAMLEHFDPTFAVMRSFEGNWRTVGLTQKVTGRAKIVPGIAKIAESLYPRARFTYRPTFHLQEKIESPTFNALRGVVERPVKPELARAYAALAEQPEFRYLTEASYLNIAGDRMVQRYMGANTRIGRAMGRFSNIQRAKEQQRIAQTLYEHGPEFKEAVNAIDPRAWKAMEEAYGTTDPRRIADAFLTERMRLGMGENIDDAMSLIEDVKPAFFGPRDDPVGEFLSNFRALSDEFIAATPPDREYAYHATLSENFDAIKRDGLVPRKPMDGPGRGDPEGVYFGSNGQELDGLLPRRNKKNVAIFRVKKDQLELTDQYDPVAYGPTFDSAVAEGYTGEYVSRTGIPPSAIEYRGADGAWHPLDSAQEPIAHLQQTLDSAVVRPEPLDIGLTDEIDNATLKQHIDMDPDHAGFGYHVTSSGSLDDIRKTGLEPRDPKVGDEVGVYFGESARALEDFVPAANRGDNVLLRASKERLEPTFENPDELISRDYIYPDELEYLAADGTWHPLLPGGPKLEPFRGTARTLLDDEGNRVAPYLEPRTPPDLSQYASEAIQSGRVAESQAANVEAGVMRGGSAASGGAVRGPAQAIPNERAAEMVWAAFKDSFRQSSVRAFQTHFFNPQRGWLERTLNHPYLGIYPLSYMWGKVLPEFARFLVARPFGSKAPAAGFNALERVQQAYLGALADDPDFRKHIEDNPNAIYFAQLLFPGDPTNLTANTPAFARHISEDLAAGRSIDANTVAREVADTGSYALAGPVGDIVSTTKAVSDLAGTADQLFANLDRAAAEYDGQFPLSGTPLIQ